MSLAIGAMLLAAQGGQNADLQKTKIAQETETRRFMANLEDRKEAREQEHLFRMEELSQRRAFQMEEISLRREEMAAKINLHGQTLAQSNTQFLLQLEEGRMARADAASLRKAELKSMDRQASLSFFGQMTDTIVRAFKS